MQQYIVYGIIIKLPFSMKNTNTKAKCSKAFHSHMCRVKNKSLKFKTRRRLFRLTFRLKRTKFLHIAREVYKSMIEKWIVIWKVLSWSWPFTFCRNTFWIITFIRWEFFWNINFSRIKISRHELLTLKNEIFHKI